MRNCAYSVPARLIGAMVQARISEAELELRYDGIEVVRYPRTIGRQARIDYRHVIASLVRKPGAFAGYLYREEMFPRAVFRQAYDRLRAADEPRADRDYLGVLLLAAERGEEEVAAALGAMLREGTVPRPQEVEPRLAPREVGAPTLATFTPELQSYDQLLAEVGT